METQFDQKILLEIIRDIDQAQMSGALSLATESDTLYLYFQAGYIVYAIQVVIGTQQSRELNQRQMLQLFGQLTNGLYKFDGAAEPAIENNWRLRAADLIMEMARLVDDENRLAREIGDFNQVFSPVFDLVERTKGLLLSKTEAEILGQLEESISIKKLIETLARPPLETLRAIYALILAGVLEPPHTTNSVDELEDEFEIKKPPPKPPPSRAMPAQSIQPAQPAATSPRAFFQAQAAKLAPLVQPVQQVQSDTVNNVSQPKPATASKPKSKINTAELEKLAGVKIHIDGRRL